MTVCTLRSEPEGGGQAPQFTPHGFQLLADAGRRLAGPLELRDVFDRVSAFMVRELADCYMLTLMPADGHLRAVAMRHCDQGGGLRLAALAAGELGFPIESVLARAASKGTVGWVPMLTVASWCPAAKVCGWGEAELQELGTGAVICAPLSVGGASIGALLLAREKAGAYDLADLALTAELGHRVGMLVDNAIQYAAARAALQELNDGLAIAAHELRAPAAAMGGYAQLMLRQIRRTDRIDRALIESNLEVINRQARRMAGLVTRLFDAARIDPSKLCVARKEIDLRGLVLNVVNLLWATAPERHIVVDAPSAIPAEVDAVRIEEVLSNLLDNALKFSPAETPVEVSLRLREGDVAVLSVRDHGIGVPLDMRDHIFERFVQGHCERQATGLGLGLYLSLQIVQEHGGRLTAEYPADGGARFVVELPTLPAEVATLTTAQPQFAAA